MKLKEIIKETSLIFLVVNSIAFPLLLAGTTLALHFYGYAVFFILVIIMNLYAWHLIIKGTKALKEKNETQNN